MKSQDIQENIENVLDQVSHVSSKLFSSVKKIAFEKELDEDAINNLKLHLGYTKNYSDLAKTRLGYSRYIDEITGINNENEA